MASDRRFRRGLLPVCLSAGWVTGPMWADANRTAVPFDHLAGTTAGGRLRVAQYGRRADARTLAVPLDPAGRPLPPFGAVVAASAPVDVGRRGDLTAVTYRVGPGGRVEPVPAHAGDCTRPATRPLPPDVAVVFLPTDRPILPARRRAKRAVAAALTPVTLVADAGLGVAAAAAAVVLAPVVLVLMLVNHKLILI